MPYRKRRVWNLELMIRSETKQQSCQWKGHFFRHLKKARQVIRTSGACWWVCCSLRGHCSSGNISPGQMVFRRYCWEVLQRLREQVCRQQQNYCGTRTNWFTMTKCRCTLLVSLQQQFLAAEIMAVFPHHSFWFKFAPCDLFLFPRLKS